jgi:hypothetical protein
MYTVDRCEKCGRKIDEEELAILVQTSLFVASYEPSLPGRCFDELFEANHAICRDCAPILDSDALKGKEVFDYIREKSH